jgi:hypothetical protein
MIIWRRFSKNEPMEDTKWCVRQDSSWRRINNDLTTMNHTSEKSKRESWCQGTVCDGEGQVDIQSEESSLLWKMIYHWVSIFIESRNEMTWRSKVEIDYMVWSTPSHNLQRVNAKARSNVATLMKSKGKTWQDSVLCKLKLKKLFLCLILSIGCLFIKRDTTWIINKVLMLNIA